MLMLTVFGVYLLTMSGHTYSRDEETMLAVSQSLVERGSWAIPRNSTQVQVTGADGRYYSQYGPGQSLAAVPWAAAGLLASSFFPADQQGFVLRLILGSFNLLVAAATCAILAALGISLGYSRRASLVLGAALAFATYLWPHSRTFFSEPLVALCLLASFYLLVLSYPRVSIETEDIATTNPTPPRRNLLFFSGLLLAAAVATKVQYVVALPAFLLYLSWRISSQWSVASGQPRSNRAPDPKSLAPRSSPLAPAVWWLIGLGAGLAPLLLYNLYAFGSPFSTGYGTDLKGTFKTPLYEGAFGLLLSPGKGLLWYALPVALSLWGFSSFARKHQAESAFVAVLGVSLVIFFGLYGFWHGDGSWGPRYLIPFLPFALLPALPLIHSATQPVPDKPNSKFKIQNSKLITRLAVSTLLALGCFVNILGVLVNFDTYINVGYDDETRHWIPYASPIVGHLNLLGQRVSEKASTLRPPERTVVFRGGVSYSEGDKASGALLPRWTTGRAVLELWPNTSRGPISVTLRLNDHRPPQLPRATVTILVNDNPVTVDRAPVPDLPISADYSFSASGQPARVTIATDTWNPAKLGENERDEELGVRLESVTVREGGAVQPYSLADDLAAPPYYPQPRWYYNPATHFLADLWPVYMLEMGMGRKTMLALGLPIIALGLLCLGAGCLGFARRDQDLRVGRREIVTNQAGSIEV